MKAYCCMCESFAELTHVIEPTDHGICNYCATHANDQSRIKRVVTLYEPSDDRKRELRWIEPGQVAKRYPGISGEIDHRTELICLMSVDGDISFFSIDSVEKLKTVERYERECGCGAVSTIGVFQKRKDV